MVSQSVVPSIWKTRKNSYLLQGKVFSVSILPSHIVYTHTVNIVYMYTVHIVYTILSLFVELNVSEIYDNLFANLHVRIC